MNLDHIKGQSAIEYLVTYGWMLVAVSVAGGAIYSQIQPACIENTSGFVGSPVQIQDFGKSADGNELSLVLENSEADGLKVNQVSISNDDDIQRKVPIRENVSSGDDLVAVVKGFKTTESCNELDIQINYDYGPLKSQVVAGQITSDTGFADILPPDPANDFEAGYPNV